MSDIYGNETLVPDYRSCVNCGKPMTMVIHMVNSADPEIRRLAHKFQPAPAEPQGDAPTIGTEPKGWLWEIAKQHRKVVGGYQFSDWFDWQAIQQAAEQRARREALEAAADTIAFVHAKEMIEAYIKEADDKEARPLKELLAYFEALVANQKATLQRLSVPADAPPSEPRTAGADRRVV